MGKDFDHSEISEEEHRKWHEKFEAMTPKEQDELMEKKGNPPKAPASAADGDQPKAGKKSKKKK